MTPEALAALHARCFDDTPAPWSARAFSLLLALPGARLVTRPGGFAIAQIAGPESELLTIAVEPGERRRGHGRDLLVSLMTSLEAEGAREIFLEVAETNLPARALYAALGFTERGRRPRYYRRREAPPIDALVLAKDLGEPGDARGTASQK